MIILMRMILSAIFSLWITGEKKATRKPRASSPFTKVDLVPSREYSDAVGGEINLQPIPRIYIGTYG